MSDNLKNLAGVIKSLTWAEMVRFSEHLESEYPHLVKAGKMDRDGIAQSLVEMADEIEEMLKENLDD